MGNALTLNQLPQKTDRPRLCRKVFPGHLRETVPLTIPIENLSVNASPFFFKGGLHPSAYLRASPCFSIQTPTFAIVRSEVV
jgi:hypothetical protein